MLIICLLFSLLHTLAATINCYSCANDFIVWQWRHFFLKRNYGLTTSDKECSMRDYRPTTYQSCYSTCFIFYLNATDKATGRIITLGVGRGCSSQFLTDEQHMHLGLGSHSKISEVGGYLPSDFDKYEITEHWCFCASENCNTETCYRSPFGVGRDYMGGSSYISRRVSYSNSLSYWKLNGLNPNTYNFSLIFVLFILLVR